MTTLLITHPCFLEHDTGPGHPERPTACAPSTRRWRTSCSRRSTREEAPLRDDVEAAHRARPPAGLHRRASRPRRPAPGERPVRLDPDTRAVAGHLGGGAARGRRRPACRRRGHGRQARQQRLLPGAPLRPPRRSRARHGLLPLQQRRHRRPCTPAQKHGAERIAVVDFDVHHGNGTQDIFWSDKDLFFASTHQMPLYPGTGALGEIRRRQHLQRAAAPRRRRRAVPRGVRIAHPARAARTSAPTSSSSRPASTPTRPTRWPTCASTRPISPGRPRDSWRSARQHAGGGVVSMLEGGYDLTALAPVRRRPRQDADGRLSS